MSIVPKIVRRVLYLNGNRSNASKQYVRHLKFEPLEERLALNAAPTLAGLPETIYLTPGTSYHVALDGEDKDGDNLTFTIEQTNNQLLTATVLEGNESVKFNVYYKKDGKDWVLVGEIVMELFEDEAPISTQRFKDLINGMKGSNGTTYSYDESTIHRIIDGFMFQGGDVQYGNGYGGTGIKIADEYSDLLQHSSRGIVSFANSGSGTTDSQFFITDNATSWLNGKHNVFGFVTEGDDIRAAVNTIPKDLNDVPLNPVMMDDFEIFTDTENGTLRIVVPENAQPGETEITVYVSDGVNEPVPYTITVKVIEEPKSAPSWDTISTLDLEAGQSYTFTLPEYLVAGQVDYLAERIEGYSAEDLKVTVNGRDVTIVVPETAGGLQWVLLQAVSQDGDDKNYGGFGSAYQYLSIYVTPKAPSIALSPEADTGKVGDNVTSVNNDAEDNVLIFEVTDMYEELAAGKNTALYLYANGYQANCTLVSQSKQDNGMWTWVIKMTTDTPLSDGTYEFTVVQNYTFTESTGHDSVTSKVSNKLQVVVDNGGPTFVSPESTIFDAKIGEQLRVEFKTDNHVASKTTYEIESVLDGSGKSIDVPEGLLIDAASGVLTWTPTSKQADDYTITVKATDGAGKSAVKTIEVIFQGGPEFSITGTSTLDEGGQFSLELKVTEEGFTGKVEFQLREGTLPADAQYTLVMTGDQTAVFTWTTTEAHGPATYSPVFVVKDEEGQTRRKDVLLTVNEINTPPYFAGEKGSGDGWGQLQSENSEDFYIHITGGEVGSSGVITISEHEEFTAQFNAKDDDIYPNEANTLTYSLQGNYPSGMSIDAATGLVSWTPGENHGGHNFELTVRVSDKSGLYDEVKLSLYVEETDSPPVFEEGNDAFQTKTGNAFDAQIHARDPDYFVDPDQPINDVYYSVSAPEGEELPEGLTIDPTTGRISWTIPYDYIDAAIAGISVTLVITATEIDSEGNDGLSTRKTIVIDLTNQQFLDAVAEATMRSAARIDGSTFAGVVTGEQLWMLLEGYDASAAGSSQQIYAGNDATATSGFRSILNPFQLSTYGSSGLVLDENANPEEDKGEPKPTSEANPKPREDRARSSAQSAATENEIILVSWREGLYDDVTEMSDWTFEEEAELDFDSEAEIHVVSPELEDAIAFLVP